MTKEEQKPTIERRLTAAVREADQAFERVGGSTRHYVNDCLLPMLEAAGLSVVDTAHLRGLEVRLADPRRDAVVKAAVAEREAYLRYICDDSDADDLRRLGKAQEKTAARVDAYTAAVEKMRRGGK